MQEERTFGGALADQLRDCLTYLENLSTFHLQKQRDRSQVRGWVSYPLPALRETLVNALYHRGYDVDQPEPTKVYLYPGRAEVISYPGPVPGIEPRHLLPDAAGARHSTGCLTHPSCLGLARIGPHPALAASADARSRSGLSQGD